MTTRTPPRPVTQDDYDQVRELHAQDLSRNEIGRRIRRSGKTVSEIAAELGLTFDRSGTRAATEARKDDARAKRARLSVALLDDAERLRQQLWKEAKAFNFGGKDNTYNEVTLDEPTFADKLKIMQATGIAVDKAVRLDEYDADPGIDAAKSMLGALAAGLGAAYDQLNRTEPDASS
ncbi:helix-turn-helix domain-containing protein [Micromonospora tarensis]|uniref:Helix-turn-helix domain-containing protein n=1 Tax=Micromonospora tarensis TaxID=2806100 RepID=A0ABS1YDA8_9ACTN|nr:helix-turn-helix domain-containing protein [Micromonospora tarensis]MBM0275337.1 helix-turn-helix domain-containing protein [Micromonospora tarensis]